MLGERGRNLRRNHANGGDNGGRKMGAVHVNNMESRGKKSFLIHVVTSNGVSSIFGSLASDLEVSIVRIRDKIEYFIRTRDPEKAREIHETIREHGLGYTLGNLLRKYSVVEVKVIANE